MKRLYIYIMSGALAIAAHAATTTPGDIIDDIRRMAAPDARQAVYELRVDSVDGRLLLRGATSLAAAHAATLDSLRRAGYDVTDSATVYPSDRFGLVSIPVASLRTRPAHAGEMATQAVMGTPVRILEHRGEWLRVQTPDGYIAYVPDSSVTTLSADEFDAWRDDFSRLVATAPRQSVAWYSPSADGPRDVVSDIVLSAIVTPLHDVEPQNGRIAVALPDGRHAWVDPADFSPIYVWASQPFDINLILDTAYSLEGSPYLWGGTSIKSVDCSGLVKVSYLSNGIILRRDASQQALTGRRLDAADWPLYHPGDLMFFGNHDTGRVTHVAIYDHDGWYIHSSGRVRRNSVDPDSDAFLYSPLHAVRIHGYEGSDGITRAVSHPWYFNF